MIVENIKKNVFETLKNVEMIMGSCKFGWHWKKEWYFVGIKAMVL